MAVPPNMIGFVEAAGLSAVAYGPDTEQQIVAVADFMHNAFRIQNPVNVARALKELYVEGWAEMSRTLTSLADGADLLMTGQTYHGVVANVAEYYDIPVAGLHHFPVQPNGAINPTTRHGLARVNHDGTLDLDHAEGGLETLCADNQGGRARATP